jgi:hypothetical protein
MISCRWICRAGFEQGAWRLFEISESGRFVRTVYWIKPHHTERLPNPARSDLPGGDRRPRRDFRPTSPVSPSPHRRCALSPIRRFAASLSELPFAEQFLQLFDLAARDEFFERFVMGAFGEVGLQHFLE